MDNLNNIDINRNIALFKELVQCGAELYAWKYDADGKLLSSNCPQEQTFAGAFSVLGCVQKMLAHAAKYDTPLFLGTAIGLVWGAAFEKENGVLKHCYVLGPAFFTDVSIRQIELGFASYSTLELSVAWKSHLIKTLNSVPTLQYPMFARYLLMLNYCLTGEKLTAADLGVTELSAAPSIDKNREGEAAKKVSKDRHKIWSAEQAMLQMVRDGDLNYKDALSASMSLSGGVPVQGSEPLRQDKTSVIVFCSIVCRAAIEGGLSPEEAYSIGDRYIQAAESAKNMEDLSAVSSSMYDDFVRRVHRCRTNPKLSPAVQKCVDYIEMHLDEKIRAETLARLAGYGEYYITRKFKDETGYFINDYVKFAKIERAKVLLLSTEDSIQQIAERLGFATRSYFSRCFKEVAGVSPAEFRAELH